MTWLSTREEFILTKSITGGFFVRRKMKEVARLIKLGFIRFNESAEENNQPNDLVEVRITDKGKEYSFGRRLPGIVHVGHDRIGTKDESMLASERLDSLRL